MENKVNYSKRERINSEIFVGNLLCPKASKNEEFCLQRAESVMFIRNGLKEEKGDLVVAYNTDYVNYYSIQDRKLTFINQKQIILPTSTSPENIIESRSGLVFAYNNSPLDPRFEYGRFSESEVLYSVEFGAEKTEEDSIIAGTLGRNMYSGFKKGSFWHLRKIFEFESVHRTGTALVILNGAVSFLRHLCLGRLRKRGLPVFRINFLLNFCHEETQFESESVRNRADEFYSSNPDLRFGLGNPDPFDYCPSKDYGEQKMLQTFFWIEDKELVLAVMNLRNNKILKRGFVSLFELVDEQDFLKIYSINAIDLFSWSYVSDLDLLDLEVMIQFEHSSQSSSEADAILRERIRAGRNDPNKLHFVTVRGESARYNIRVFGMLNRENRKINYIPVGVGNIRRQKVCGRTLIQSIEDHKKIRVEILEGDKGLDNRSKEVHSQDEKVVNEERNEEGFKVIQAVELSKKVLYDDLGITVSSHTSVEIIDDSTILVVSSRYLVLVDLTSKKVISSLKFNQGCPQKRGDDQRESEGLVAEIDREISELNFFKPHSDQTGGDEEGELLLRHVFSFNLRQIEGLVHAWKYYPMKKVGEGLYQLVVAAEMTEDPETVIISRRYLGFTFDFNLKTASLCFTCDQGSGYSPRIIFNDFNGWQLIS